MPSLWNGLTRTRRLWIGLLTAALVAVAALTVRTLWKRRAPSVEDHEAASEADEKAEDEPILGLSEEEAEERRTTDPTVDSEDRRRRVQRTIVRQTVFSIFNLTLVGLAIAMWLLNDLWGAIMAILVLIFNVVMTIAQQMLANKQIDGVAERARPSVAVIRDGKTRRIDLADLVEGDVISIGPGDELVADGELLTRPPIGVSRSSDADAAVRRRGDQLHMGEQCVRGWGAYRVVDLDPGLSAKLDYRAIPDGTLHLTPIQRLMDGILRVLLGLVALFLVLLVLKIANAPVITPLLQDEAREIASIIFSLAPSGLYFTALVTYAMGAALLARNGALVRDTGLVEALAQVTVICFGKSGVLTQTELSMEIIDQPEAGSSLPPNRIVQLLGVFAHSVSSQSSLTQMIGDAYDGQAYHPASELTPDAAHGFQAISLDEPEVRGTYVLASEAGLASYVQQPTGGESESVETAEEEAGSSQPIWSRATSGIRHLFRRGQEPETAADDNVDEIDDDRPRQSEQDTPAAPLDERQDASDEEAEPSPSFAGRVRRSRLWRSIDGRYRRLTRQTESEAPKAEEKPKETSPSRIVFAYSPEPGELIVDDGRPVLPRPLMPLCYLDITEEKRQGADQAVQAFAASGVDVKVLSADAADDVDEMLAQLGLREPGDAGAATLTGGELSKMPEHERADAVAGAAAIANLDGEQRSEVIRLLRGQGESVAMVGNILSDVRAMDEASLSVALHTASQAAIRTADIILLGDTLDNLASVLQIGQRVVNGLLNNLKLNLTQIGYVLLLLIAMILTRRGFFYYTPSQGGIVIFFTVIVPSVGLTLWAMTGAVSRHSIFSRLARFAIPAPLTIAAAVLIVDAMNGPVADYEYSQLTVTWFLLMVGSVLVLFVQPAVRLLAGAGRPTGDWRPAWLAAGLFVASMLLALLPRAEEWFSFTLLDSWQQYLLLAAAAVVWAVVLQLIWRLASLLRVV